MGELVDQLGKHFGTGDERPSEEEMGQELAAPGEDALLPVGIVYSANWKTLESGMDKHAREQVLSLAMSGLPVHLQSTSTQFKLRDELDEEVLSVEYLENVSFSRTAITIRQLVIHNLETFQAHIIPRSARSLGEETINRVCNSTIVYTSWERDRVHPEYLDTLKKVGQLWVPCEANKRAFVSSGMNADRVKVVPYPYNPPDHNIAFPRGGENIPPHRRFYHIGKWEPRKNQHMMIGAFLKAFNPNKDKVSLLLKVSSFKSLSAPYNWADYPNVEESLDFWMRDSDVVKNGWNQHNVDRLIRIITDKVSDADIQKIHKGNNIYVSTSHGEGWDIPAFEAKVSGNRLIHTGFGGSEDYAISEPGRGRFDQDCKFQYSMQPVHSGYLWESDAKWATPDFYDMVEVMRRVQAPRSRVIPRYFNEKFSRAAVGQQMRGHIQELAEELGCWEELSKAGGFG